MAYAAEPAGDNGLPSSASADDGEDNATVLSSSNNDEEDEVRAFQETCRQEMERRLSNLQGHFNVNLDDGEYSDLAERFHNQNKVQIVHRQIDVLRTNKIFRDVARFMGGADWRPLFRRLVAALPDDVVRAEIVRVEREKAFLQPYKALTVWKELSGNAFDIDALVEGLVACGMPELADKTLATLQSDGDSLYSLSDFGKSASTSTRTSSQGASAGRKVSSGSSSSATAGAGEEGKERQLNGNAAKLHSQTSSDASSSAAGATGDGGLSDGQLLRLARKIGGQWVSLGKALNLPHDQVKEIWDKEGDTYQGAFQMLWAWRDITCTLALGEAVAGLSAALTNIGRTELAADVNKWL